MAMKKCIYLLLCFFSNLVSVADVAQMATENVNLIILNDVSENFEISLSDNSIGNYGAITMSLIQALLEGKDPILCTKALLHNIFFMQNLYKDLSQDDLLNNINKYKEYKNILEEMVFEKPLGDDDQASSSSR